MASSLLLLLLVDDETEEKYFRRHQLKTLRDSSDPFNLTDNLFKSHFRLPKEVCSMLVEELMPKDTQATSLPFGVRFFCCLLFFAHGSYQKCVANSIYAPLSQSSVSRSIKFICSLIVKYKATEISFPTTDMEQLAIKSRFYSKFRLKGVIGAIDCTHVALICPPKNDPTTPCSLYMNRKGYYSINVEAVCDTNLRFLAVNANFPGSRHDSGIWSTSPVRTFISGQTGSWLLGDQGYPLEPWLLTPIAQPTSLNEENYNKMHCKARNVIERCFGVAKSRFRCISKFRTLSYCPEIASKIVNACLILHNIVRRYAPQDELQMDEQEIEIEGVVDIPATATRRDLHREGERIRQYLVNNI